MTVQAQQKSKVITLLVAVVVFFAVLYLPDEFLDLFGKKMEAVGQILTKTVGAATISALLMWILFVIDHLPNGKGLKSKFFVYCRPSNRAVAECKSMKLDQEQADALWYPFWNSLEAREPADNLRRYYEESFTHSYGCRFIFYFVPLLAICIVSSLVSVVLCTWVLRIWPADMMLAVRLTVLAVFSLVLWWTWRSNTVEDRGAAATSPYQDRYEATGAWKAYKDLEGLLYVEFEKAVLKPLVAEVPA
ncbi:MAG TPA: hypothetical protein VGG20_24555 [Thermoanaerobaculia bacterium]|jgi:hypothetical protein